MPSPTTMDISGFLATWGPRVVAAIIILIVTYIAGKAVKWAIAKALDRIPALASHNAATGSGTSAGASLGDVGFWLVFLIGLVATLNTLQLSQVATPLNTLLNQVMGFIPNIVGAGLIFFIGFILATVTRKLVVAAISAIDLSRLTRNVAPTMAPTGMSPARIADAVGTLVFVAILIPIAIAALQALRIEAISGPAVAVLSTILSAIPRVLSAAIVLAIGYVIGRWIAGVIERVLPEMGFDRVLGSLSELTSYKAAAVAETASPETASPEAPSAGVSPSKVVATMVLAAIMAFTAIEAARLLDFAIVAEIILNVLALAAKVVVGAGIIAAGVFVADILGNLVARASDKPTSPAGTLTRWATTALAVAMGLKYMGLADEIVTLAFGIILGSAGVAAALAFGLGGRQAAGRLAEEWVDKIK